MSALTTDELLAQMANVSERLETALMAAGTSEAPGESGWTTSEIVGHLCDAARYWGARMRLAVYEDRPRLEPFDQDGLVRLAAYRYVPSAALAREFCVINEALVAWLRQLRPEQWERVGVHAERGPLTVRQMVEIEAAHELEHARLFDGAA